jgi:hypothetical protein
LSAFNTSTDPKSSLNRLQFVVGSAATPPPPGPPHISHTHTRLHTAHGGSCGRSKELCVCCGMWSVCVCVCHGKQRRLRSTISRHQHPYRCHISRRCCCCCCCCCCSCLRSSSVHLSQIFVRYHRWRPAPKGESRISRESGPQ